MRLARAGITDMSESNRQREQRLHRLRVTREAETARPEAAETAEMIRAVRRGRCHCDRDTIASHHRVSVVSMLVRVAQAKKRRVMRAERRERHKAAREARRQAAIGERARRTGGIVQPDPSNARSDRCAVDPAHIPLH